jgi:ketosteroid isomerase-like protein
MTEENVEALRRVYERWAEGDFRASLEVFDPLVLMVQSADFPDAGAYLGVERVTKFMRGFLEPWTRLTMAAEEFTATGDSVVVAVHQRGVGGGSGVATELRYFHVWTFRGDRAIRLETLRNRDEAYTAVGVPAD